MSGLFKMRSRLIVFIFSFLILSSCQNDAKEKYLIAISETLDRELAWIVKCIDERNLYSHHLYDYNGKPNRMSILIEKSDSSYVNFKSVFTQSRDESNSEVDIIKSIEKKTKILSLAINTFSRLNEIGDTLENLRSFEFHRGSEFEIVTIPEKVILTKGDSFKAKLIGATKPGYAPSFAYKTFVNENLIPSDENGVAQFIIPGDSIKKMEPGNYVWQAKVWVDMGYRDSLFTSQQTFTIIPERCD